MNNYMNIQYILYSVIAVKTLYVKNLLKFYRKINFNTCITKSQNYNEPSKT